MPSVSAKMFIHINAPPAKNSENYKSAQNVSRRNSLGLEPINSNNPPFTGAASARGGACLPGRGRQKVHGTVIICNFCRSAQHRPNAPFRSDMAATSAPLGVNFAQLPPSPGPLGSNLAPQLSPKLDPFGGKFGPNSGPHGFNMGDMAGPIRNPQDTMEVYITWGGLAPRIG